MARVTQKVKRTLAHTSKATVKISMSGLYNQVREKHHFHFCSDRACRLIYEDNCADPERNGRCPSCRGTTRNNLLVRDPQECCLDNCVQITDRDVLLAHKLAGPGPWFICKTCARSHGWPCVTTT
jgi:hypothetical protein